MGLTEDFYQTLPSFTEIEPFLDSSSLSRDLLTAILTCYGAKAKSCDLEKIQARQNPYAQKRGGLGHGGFLVVRSLEASSSTKFENAVQSGIVNVNLFATRQASHSPLSLELLDEEARFLRFKLGESVVATGATPLAPKWLGDTLTDGTPVGKLIQAHGSNLVSIWGKNRCVLFDEGNACSFCMFDGGANNVSRTMPQIIEAIHIVKSSEDHPVRPKNLTLTTGMLTPEDLRALAQDVRQFKETHPEFRLAIQMNPTRDLGVPERLADAGLDTLMVPLDSYSPLAQDRHLPGKKHLLGDAYWNYLDAAVPHFKPGNVTSTIIVGLEPMAMTIEGMKRMIQRKVVPEPLPVRWDNQRLQEPRPLTRPSELLRIRLELDQLLSQMDAGVPLAGCTACGGCTGIKKSR